MKYILAVFAIANFAVYGSEWVENAPAANWQESSLTGNGTIGAMVEGRIENESIHLSHCKLYLPEPGGTPPALVNHPKKNPSDYNNRDGYMAACDLKISMRFGKPSEYSRRSDFETGECIVSAKDGKGRKYERRVAALRGANIIAVKAVDETKSDVEFALAGIEPSGRMDIAAFSKGVRRIVSEPCYYRCEFKNENPWNKIAGYEALLLVAKDAKDAARAEAFVAIEPLLRGQETNRAEMEAHLAAAAEKGYDALLAESAAKQKELMDRVTFTLEGPANAAEIVRNFNSGRYNIISSVGGDHVPNLQGLWAGTWSAPWFASFTVNGNLPCAISFFCRGNTPEFNESLLAWIEARLPEMRDEAKRHFGARGFRIAAQTTVAGVETDSNASYPHIYWHGGAAWLLSRLYDGYRHTLDEKWLKRIYPLMKETACYYEDVLVEMPDGTLGFNPSYSPENWPAGKRATAVNATMDNAIAKQFLGEVVHAAETLGVDAEERAKWASLRARLTPYKVSENGFFAEWLAPGQPDNNEHRHASHLYALYDDAPPEILENAELVAAVKKTIDARMDFNENRSRTMAFGYVQNGLAACKIGDAERAARCLKLLTDKNWLKGGGSCHDWKNCFNTDISGGYPYLISEMLVHSEEGWVKFLPAKPTEWKSGSIKGLLLRGGCILENLEWKDEDYVAMVKFPDGTAKRFEGKAGGRAVVLDKTAFPEVQTDCYWHWMNGNISKEGITADLEYMKAGGMDAAMIFDVGIGVKRGDVDYGSEKWEECIAWASQEATRLGMELSLHNSPGYSACGGPWIAPEESMKQLVWRVESSTLEPRTSNLDPPSCYREIARYPLATADETIDICKRLEKGESVEIALDGEKEIAALNVWRGEREKPLDPFDGPRDYGCTLKVETFDGAVWSAVGDVRCPVLRARDVAGFLRLKSPAKASRLRLTSNRGANLARVEVISTTPAEGRELVIGWTTTAQMVTAAPDAGIGLECDKFSRRGVDAHFDRHLAPLFAKIGKGAFKYIVIDSWEAGRQDWTDDFPAKFEEFCHYDCLPWLPALTGRNVMHGRIYASALSKEDSQRELKFLLDYEAVKKHLFETEFLAPFAERTHKLGLLVAGEPYGDGDFDMETFIKYLDLPMSEYWAKSHYGSIERPMRVNAAAKAIGKTYVGCEAFTAYPGDAAIAPTLENFAESIDCLKSAGVKRFIFHSIVHQPSDSSRFTMGPFGTRFGRAHCSSQELRRITDYIH